MPQHQEGVNPGQFKRVSRYTGTQYEGYERGDWFYPIDGEPFPSAEIAIIWKGKEKSTAGT